MRTNSCYSILFSNLKQQKPQRYYQSLLSVSWVLYIRRNPVTLHNLFQETVTAMITSYRHTKAKCYAVFCL